MRPVPAPKGRGATCSCLVSHVRQQVRTQATEGSGQERARSGGGLGGLGGWVAFPA